MQQDEVNRRVWERAALKLLKGKPLSSLTKVALSGLKTEVLYTNRPEEYRTATRQSISWDEVEIHGRVAGRFDTSSKWMVGSSPIITRVYLEDITSSTIDGQRIEVVDTQLVDLRTLSQTEMKGILHLDPYTVYLQSSVHTVCDDGTFEPILDRLQSQEGNYPITVDASVVYELGGTEREELLWIVLSLWEYAKRGVAWDSIWIQTSADTKIMQTVVKFRALRQLIQGLATQVDIETQYPYICAETSLRMFSKTDEHNNMLRGLYAAVGAVWGSVDGLIIHGYDALSAASQHGHRIAQNIHSVLKEESGIDGWLDPLFGSYQVEHQTEQLCAQVWTEFVSYSEGGLLALINGGFPERLKQLRYAKHSAIATQKDQMTGVTAFANPTERLGSDWMKSVSKTFVRDAQPFEMIRSHFEEETGFVVQIVCLGTMIECKARLEYIQQQLATVGLCGEIVKEFDETASLRCIVGTDKTYESNLASILKQVENTTEGPLWIVGRLSVIPETAQTVSVIHRGVNMQERWNDILVNLEEDSVSLMEEE